MTLKDFIKQATEEYGWGASFFNPETFEQLIRADERARLAQQWGASQVMNPEYVAEQKRRTEELRSMLAEPVGFAGVEIWIGNKRVVRLLTQTELHHAIEPWLLVELASQMCVEDLKGAA